MRSAPEPGSARIGRLFPLTLFLVSALLVTACGGGDSEPPTPVTPAPTPAPPPPAPEPLPSVPANFRVSASGGDFIEWSWDPVEGASGYRVQFSLDDMFTDADEIIARSGAQNTYRRKVATGTEAHLRVQSSFGAGDAVEFSEWSLPVRGRTSGVLGVPANLRVSASGEDFIEWSWDPVEGASGYRVQFSLDDMFTDADEIIARSGAQNTYRRKVATGTEAHLRVQSSFGAGDAVEFSEWSLPVRGRTSGVLGVPANLRVSASGGDFIEWSWDPVEGASGYRVQFSLDDMFTDADEIIARSGAQNTYRRKVATGTEAYLRVQSSFGAGDAVEFSEWSLPVRGRTSGVLGVPANLRVSASGEDFIEWSWDPVESVSGYRVQFSLDDNFTEADEIIERTAAQNAYRRQFAKGTEAHLRVQSSYGAGDAVEYSEWSAPVRGRTLATPVVPGADRAALVALFEATRGPIWTSAENWLTDAPLDEWYGVETDQGRVTRLELGRNQLIGSLPPEIGQLGRLEALLLYDNQLSGPIPPEVGRLISLDALWLQQNGLTGSIPAEIGQLARLRTLDLQVNQLAGAIPPEIGQLARLENLSLRNNGLTGSIPAEIGQLARLKDLLLSGNQLTGVIPPEIGQLARLENLWVAQNRLTGSIPPEIGQLARLKALLLRDNQLTGAIPPETGRLTSLTSLGLAENGLTGPIPPEIGRLANLQQLLVGDNHLTGSIPPELGQLGDLRDLSIHSTELSGPLPLSLSDLPLSYFLYYDTQLCVPADAGFRAWLQTIQTHRGTGRDCGN